MQNYSKYILLFLLVSALAACRKDLDAEPDENQAGTVEQLDSIAGFLLLNEGNMNMNKASLDYYDYAAGSYSADVYSRANAQGGGLGDVGNDLAVYGSKIYVVVNASNKIEVLDLKTRKKIRQINLNNCRYITFSGGRAYVTAYLGVVGDPNAPNGSVCEIDTATLTVTRRLSIGRQPEELAVVGHKLYVAHSGGYSPPNYERHVSVIDLSSFAETSRIDLGINLHRLRADAYGDLYVSSRGDLYDVPPKLFVIDTKTERIKASFEIPVSNLAISADTAYICGATFNYLTGTNKMTYMMFDVRTETLVNRSFITDGMDRDGKILLPYGIAVNPENHDILVTDARDYVSPGRLHCFGRNGKLKWSATTGDIPSKIAFIKKTR